MYKHRKVKFSLKESGASLVEYAILVALIATITLPSAAKLFFKSADTMCATSYGMGNWNVKKVGEKWALESIFAFAVGDSVTLYVYSNPSTNSCAICAANLG